MAFVAAEAAEGAGAARMGGAGARRATSKRAAAKPGKRAAGGPDRHVPTNLNTLDPQAVGEELEARKADAAWAKAERDAGRDPDRSTKPAEDEPAPDSSSSSSNSRPLFVVGKAAPVQTGGGVLIGAGLWVLFINYAHGGIPQVKRLLAAKFLNRTGA